MERAVIEFLLLTIYLLISAVKGYGKENCGPYGCADTKISFVPAPPGYTPNCAIERATFCETVDHYPEQLIRFLIVNKCSYDFTTLLSDESNFNFNSYMRSKPEYHHGYEPPRAGVPNSHSPPIQQFPRYPIAGQSTVVYGTPFNYTHREGYDYNPPNRFQRNVPVKSQTNSIPYENGQLSPDQRWKNMRYSMNAGQKQSSRGNPFLQTFVRPDGSSRNKRQIDPEVGFLCPTYSRYIMPRAALNIQGNWMYVVNLLESNEKWTQLVQSEICVRNKCNGLCHPPEGYSSKCEQQYVQKRLVALNTTGDRLYTDLFWFPHGCSCKVERKFVD